MKITLNLTNGQSVSAFVDDDTREYLNEILMEEGCFADESEITDYDYAEYALLLNGEYVFIFDKKYSFDDDVASFEVDRNATENDSEKEERIESYRAIYQDALDYALDFFHGDISEVFSEHVHRKDADFLPILFTTDGTQSRTLPQFTLYGNQPAMYVNMQEATLSDTLKENIRHAIIQYTLWLADLPYACSSAEFACLGNVFGVLPYKVTDDKHLKFLRAFQDFYGSGLKSCSNYHTRLHMIGQAVSAIHTCKTANAYDKVLKSLVRQA